MGNNHGAVVTTVSANLIHQEDTWDPHIFCGGLRSVLESRETMSLRQLHAEIVEGWRTSSPRISPSGEQPMYRMSNIRQLELGLEVDHCDTPQDDHSRCVRAGDVVVTKAAPIRAALATNNTFRHLVDANCYLVRGLNQAEALWLALCLNQPAYADYLTRKSGSAVVPRVRMSALREVPFPNAGAAIGTLSQRVVDCLDRRTESRVELVRFVDDVRLQVDRFLPEFSLDDVMDESETTSWSRFFLPADIEDSLVPAHVAVNRHQRALRLDSYWVSMRQLVTEERVSQGRVGTPGDRMRLLRLSDVGDDLSLPVSVPLHHVQGHRRVFSEPISENDVLLSTLVTSPRVAFAGSKPQADVFPTDHWHRLRFRETPGAWALVLNTPAIHRQLLRMAVGTVQQFALPSTVRRLVLPDVPREVRIKWDAFLRRWQCRRRSLDEQWFGLMQDCYAALRETHRTFGSWTQQPELLQAWMDAE